VTIASLASTVELALSAPVGRQNTVTVSKPRIDRSRMKMTLEKVDGRWRANKVELP
jgi:Mce-associated membrane protein